MVEVEVFFDDRGYFFESYHRDRYREAGITEVFVQDNHSCSARGVLRGIHFQDLSAPMAKLVRCSYGAILDVAVDLRIGSRTFGRWIGVELSSENQRQLFVPVGFGHAFLALSDRAEVQYKCSGGYSQSAERAVRWDDADLGIQWPISDPIVSRKDREAMSLREYRSHPVFLHHD